MNQTKMRTQSSMAPSITSARSCEHDSDTMNSIMSWAGAGVKSLAKYATLEKSTLGG